MPAVQSGQSLATKAASPQRHEAAAALGSFAHLIPGESFCEQQNDARTARIFSSTGATSDPVSELAKLGLAQHDPFPHTSDYSTKSDGTGHYHIEVDADEAGKNATAIRWEQRPVAGSKLTHPGVYCLRSNQTDWSAETMWRTYLMLTDLEAVFRSLKSELGLRPIFHQKQHRSNGHLFITVLAYQLVQVIRRRLREQGEHSSWDTLRSILGGQQRVTCSFLRDDGSTLHVRKATRAEPDQGAIYDAPGVDPAPGGIKKLVAA